MVMLLPMRLLLAHTGDRVAALPLIFLSSHVALNLSFYVVVARLYPSPPLPVQAVVMSVSSSLSQTWTLVLLSWVSQPLEALGSSGHLPEQCTQQRDQLLPLSASPFSCRAKAWLVPCFSSVGPSFFSEDEVL